MKNKLTGNIPSGTKAYPTEQGDLLFSFWFTMMISVNYRYIS
ncbi:hypothetical protein V1502_08800 [Bacillus sp. SCS-153A]